MIVCRPRRFVGLFVGLIVCGLWFVHESHAAEPTGSDSNSVSVKSLRVGFLAINVDASGNPVGEETAAAWNWLKATVERPVLFRIDKKEGLLEAATGKPIDLDAFDVLWHHQGETVTRWGLPPGTKFANQINQFASSGRGVYLSGGGLLFLWTLSLEGYDRPQGHPFHPFNERRPAGVVPVEKDHPLFCGLKADESGTIWTAEGGFPAVCDYTWGGPFQGMLLARTPEGVENPITEYRRGKGRVLCVGWHLPHFSDTKNVHRENLDKLTKNALAYLAAPKGWHPFEIRSAYRERKLPPAPQPVPKKLLPTVDEFTSLRQAIEDLRQRFPDQYTKADAYLAELQELETQLATPERDAAARRFEALRREALLANPLLDFDRLMYLRRRTNQMGLPTNYQSNSSLPQAGYDNRVETRSIHDSGQPVRTIFQPEGGRFVGDIDLHFDADKMLFSMSNIDGRWRIFELDGLKAADQGQPAKSARMLPLLNEADIDNYDGCYLPDGRVIFNSTAPFTGVPCVSGSSHVTNLYRLEQDGSIRRLTNDQEHNWSPRVLPNGRVLYQRWEYADIAHSFYRLLFHMNPDGTNQAEFYGSNSYWPTSMFYARPVPGHPTMVATIVGGHHETPRMGELLLLDPARGRFETEGVVTRIGGKEEEVKPVILDGLIGNSWPRFLHPWPLNEKYLIVSCKPTIRSNWGLYLVDVFGNYVLLHEESGYAMMEPIPLQARPTPPVIADRSDPTQKEGEVYMVDVYTGPGLEKVPRGTVKSLRLLTYQFAYHGMGGEGDRIGLDGPWDVKRVIGTVPVEADGSARFRVPACTPISIQPLDAEGKAIQLMRSWLTAMPGEVLSCVGCHEAQNSTPPSQGTLAARRPAREIKPWYGPTRGFSFKREVQPVLDRYCIGCHDGKTAGQDGQTLGDLTARPAKQVPGMGGYRARFTPSYMALRRHVRTPTLESDAHMLPPYEYHADTSPLIRMLRRGHHDVKLDVEAWDRLITWIDCNAPAHGTWFEVCGDAKADQIEKQAKRRREMMLKTTGIDEDQEAVFEVVRKIEPVVPESWAASKKPAPAPAEKPVAKPSPAVVKEPAELPTRQVDLGDGVSMELVRLPAGETDGKPTKEFWIGRFEVTNRQFAQFDQNHDSRLETGDFLQFGPYQRGYDANRLTQPVVRIGRDRAEAFCRWLSEKTGTTFDLPTDVEWEYACRAGTTTTHWYGGTNSDFSNVANLADLTLREVDYHYLPIAIPEWRVADARFDDQYRISAPVGTYAPNPWGLFDMHGNVAEWTKTEKQSDSIGPAPLTEEDRQLTRRAAVCGGSWHDRPVDSTSASRRYHFPHQPLFDVGFRVIVREAKKAEVAKK